jgi:hypothetical protein
MAVTAAGIHAMDAASNDAFSVELVLLKVCGGYFSSIKKKGHVFESP